MSSNARVTRVVVESAAATTDAPSRITRLVSETAAAVTAAVARVTRVVNEVAMDFAIRTRVTKVVSEVAGWSDTDLRVTKVVSEVAASTGALRITRVVHEVACSTVYVPPPRTVPTGPSRSRLIACAAIVEREYGGLESSMEPIEADRDGFCVFRVGDPVAMQIEMIDVRSLVPRGARTPGRRWYTWEGTVYSGRTYIDINSLGDPYSADQYETGLQRKYSDRPWGPLWLSCGLAADYSVPGRVIFTPESDLAAHRSCRIVTELDGTFFDMRGARGSFTINGTPGLPLEIAFSMLGIPGTLASVPLDPVSAPERLENVTHWAAWDGGSTDNQLFQCAAAIIVSGDTVLRNFTFKSFSFDRGIDIEARKDANSDQGVREYGVADAHPTLELVIECSQDVNNWIDDNDVLNPWADWRNSNTHAVAFSHGVRLGDNAEWYFHFPHCQLVSVALGESEVGARNLVLTYEVIHPTIEDGEFAIVWIGAQP